MAFTTLDENWIAHALDLSARSCDVMYRVRESKNELEHFYWLFIELFLSYFFGSRLKYVFERSLKVLPRILKRFKAFQVVSFLLRVTCVRLTQTSGRQSQRATESPKTVVPPRASSKRRVRSVSFIKKY